MINSIYLWLLAVVLFAVVEASTAGIVSIWFAFGSLCALLASALNAPLWLQFIIFIVTSAISLILTRPLVKKVLLKNTVPTNSDMLIGERGIVVDSISNLNEVGTVKIKGKVWTARSASGSDIPEGAIVSVERIEGVKLIVKLSQ